MDTKKWIARDKRVKGDRVDGSSVSIPTDPPRSLSEKGAVSPQIPKASKPEPQLRGGSWRGQMSGW